MEPDTPLTISLQAFNVVLTAYVFLGSLHAKSHTAQFYGGAYRGSQERVPLFATTP